MYKFSLSSSSIMRVYRDNSKEIAISDMERKEEKRVKTFSVDIERGATPKQNPFRLNARARYSNLRGVTRGILHADTKWRAGYLSSREPTRTYCEDEYSVFGGKPA